MFGLMGDEDERGSHAFSRRKAEVRRQLQEGSFRKQPNEAVKNCDYTQPETEARAEGQSEERGRHDEEQEWRRALRRRQERRQRGLCVCDSSALKEKGNDTAGKETRRQQKEEMTQKI